MIVAGYFTEDRNFFKAKAYESLEHLHVLNRHEINQQLEKFLLSLNKSNMSDVELRTSFDLLFQPIWKILKENNDEQINSVSLPLIKSTCEFVEDLLYFNAKFKSLLSKKCRETLIDDYLEYINIYLLDLILEESKSTEELEEIQRCQFTC